MYQITCDGLILHDVRLETDYRVISPKCKLKMNTTGTLTFQIAPTHPYYSQIQKLKSEITLTQDGEWIFTGRVLNDEKDFDNIKTVECEGELAYLLDSNQRQAEYHDLSVSGYFTTLINKHNAAVPEQKKQFTVGIVNVQDNNDSLMVFRTSVKASTPEITRQLDSHFRMLQVTSTHSDMERQNMIGF